MWRLFPCQAFRKAFQSHRTVAQMRQETRGDTLIEAEDVSLGNPNLRKHDFILMGERKRCWMLGWRAGATHRRTCPDVLRCGSRCCTLCCDGVWMGLFILHLDQQPGRFLAALGHADQGKIPLELAAMQLHLKVSGVDAFSYARGVWLIGQYILVCALVPDVHQAGTILPCR